MFWWFYRDRLTSKDTLLIPSSGRKADMVARKALENGVNFEYVLDRCGPGISTTS